MNFLRTIRSLFFSSAFVLLFAFASPLLTSSDWSIGDIRYSMLPPTLFEEIHPGWVLMDGRTVKGSKYSDQTLIDTVPDAQNMFIRGMGGKYDSKNGARDRPIGSKQSFATAEPNNKYSITIDTDGAHTHDDWYYAVKSGRGVSGSSASPYNATRQTGGGNHSHSATISGGDKETRPVNITAYTYIKIN
jgi:hypothetical protein